MGMKRPPASPQVYLASSVPEATLAANSQARLRSSLATLEQCQASLANDAEHDTATTSYPLWVINHDTIRKLVERGGIVAPKGPAGSMILFHGCLVHASTSNLSPWNRVSVYLSLCAVSNHIRRFKRPGYIAHRDFTPIRCLPDDCLLKHYDVPLPWKDGTPPEELHGVLKAA